MYYLIFLGAPGAGKGTQSKILQERLGVPQISTGDMLRATRESGSALGKRVAKVMDEGSLVSDEIVFELVKERLSQDDARNGAILDGYPRTPGQAQALRDLVEVDAVISIEIAEELLLKRLSGRRTCHACGAMFHVEFKPTTQVGVCDKCGGATYQRPDDKEESIRHRLSVYHQSTAPLVEYYSGRGLLKAIDGVGAPEVVAERIHAALGEQ